MLTHSAAAADASPSLVLSSPGVQKAPHIRVGLCMAKKGVTLLVKLASTANTGFFYVKRKCAPGFVCSCH